MGNRQALSKLFLTVLAASLVMALALLPAAAAGGWVITSSSQTMNSNLQDMSNAGTLPLTSTITDRKGKPIAWVYEQRRSPAPSDKISADMKQSIVAIEDRRFYSHSGVDVRGTLRAMAANLSSGGVAEGASTINQQYVKNYLYLIEATTDEERNAAIETSIPRKLREMKMASDLDRKLSKDEILTRYLNLISYGRGAYGIEDAANTYFGTTAAQLNVAQSALLAGLVQSTSALDPWRNPDGALARRNQVLQARVEAGTLTRAQADAAAAEPLGILPQPGGHPNGCISAGGAGFFCDYALSWLAEHGIDSQRIARGGLTITTTLDADAQRAAEQQTAAKVDPTAPGVAEIANFIAPSKDGHEVVAMASSRVYGLDAKKMETVLPLTHTMQGHGAGSIFKIFTAAAALEAGMGLNSNLAVPSRVEVDGMGAGGAQDCPPNKYCVENAGPYPSAMTLKQALATSPNTPFVRIEKEIGTARPVDIAVALGLRSYAAPKSYNSEYSVADYVKATNMGSFTLGPTPVNPLELANVAASLADNGRWCEPSPILSVKDSTGKNVDIKRGRCEQALDKGVANAVANGLGADSTNGTAAAAASAEGWNGPISAKTGTTETSFSAAFLGFTPGWAGATYIVNDGGTPSSLCSGPVRQCERGDLFGGEEPARTFFGVSSQMVPDYGGPGVPAAEQRYQTGNGRFKNLEPVQPPRRQSPSTTRLQNLPGEIQNRLEELLNSLPLPRELRR